LSCFQIELGGCLLTSPSKTICSSVCHYAQISQRQKYSSVLYLASFSFHLRFSLIFACPPIYLSMYPSIFLPFFHSFVAFRYFLLSLASSSFSFSLFPFYLSPFYLTFFFNVSLFLYSFSLSLFVSISSFILSVSFSFFHICIFL
jgi:hypothetical protein